MSREEKWHTKRIDNPRYVPLSHAIMSTIKYHPTLKKYASVIDLGSSCGSLLKELENRQNWEYATGIDVSPYAKKHWQPKSENAQFIQANLNESIDDLITKEYDVIITLETAEHLEHEKHLLDAAYKASKEDSIFVFSGAVHGQKGRGHINCHWLGYWQKEIEKYGWILNHQMTFHFHYELGKFNHSEIVVPEYYVNSMVFQRMRDINSEDGLKH